MNVGNNSAENALTLLQDIFGHDNIAVGTMQSMLMAKKIDTVRKLHTFAITPPKQAGGRWQTYYKDINGNRKCLKAGSEEDILKKLIDVYLNNSHIDNITFDILFNEWLDFKKTITDSPNTITRHRQHYNKYFVSSVLAGKKLRQLDALTLEAEFNRLVRENNLSRKEWINIKTIPKGMFEFAMRKGYIDTNPMEQVLIHVKYRQVVKKSGKTQTYNSEELKQLNEYLDTKYTETEDTSFLAVKLNFLLGLRVGELVSLKWTDIEDNSLHIVREEIRNQEKGTYEVVEHTKTHTDRYVLLIPKALALLEKIEHQGEYIFMRNGSRLTSRQIAYVLEKYAERQGMRTKSTHKMRKTYASMLAANGVPLDAIRELLGHSDLQTTLGYIYNPLTDTETASLIENAL